MTFFGVLGKNPELSLTELELVKPSNVSVSGEVVFFESQKPEMIKTLGGLIKWGQLIQEDELGERLEGVSIVGVNTKHLGLMCKRKYKVRRYKDVDFIHSDLEIKRKGVEILDLGQDKIGWVNGRQNIDFYSALDFEKPASGMQVGMMPAKLTHILVNIGVNLVTESDECTIYDPFCGFGTTNFVANYLGHNSIGSDINPTPAKQNMNRWKRGEFNAQEKHLTFFKHDVTTTFTHPVVKKADVLVTEGWLGPVIKHEMLKHQDQKTRILQEYIPQIEEVYATFLKNIGQILPETPIVITLPEYTRLPHPIIFDRVTEAAEKYGRSIQAVGEVYKRKKQLVGRRVVIIK